MMKVIRDQSGALINIGDWNFEWRKEESGLLDSDGRPILKDVADNPLPDGAYEDQAEIVIGWDGGLYEATDPRALG